MHGETSVREQRREERRARVIESAMRLAVDGGYEAVHMRAVADHAEVALGTIYRYFSGKDEMLIAGLAEWLGLMRRRMKEAPIEGHTASERLSAALTSASGSTDSVPMLMGALVTALGTTDVAAAKYKLAVEREVRKMVVMAIGDDESIDAIGVARVIGHVWGSSLSRWIGGLAEIGSVGIELRHAVAMLLDD